MAAGACVQGRGGGAISAPGTPLAASVDYKWGVWLLRAASPETLQGLLPHLPRGLWWGGEPHFAKHSLPDAQRATRGGHPRGWGQIRLCGSRADVESRRFRGRAVLLQASQKSSPRGPPCVRGGPRGRGAGPAAGLHASQLPCKLPLPALSRPAGQAAALKWGEGAAGLSQGLLGRWGDTEPGWAG